LSLISDEKMDLKKKRKEKKKNDYPK